MPQLPVPTYLDSEMCGDERSPGCPGASRLPGMLTLLIQKPVQPFSVAQARCILGLRDWPRHLPDISTQILEECLNLPSFSVVLGGSDGGMGNSSGAGSNSSSSSNCGFGNGGGNLLRVGLGSLSLLALLRVVLAVLRQVFFHGLLHGLEVFGLDQPHSFVAMFVGFGIDEARFAILGNVKEVSKCSALDQPDSIRDWEGADITGQDMAH